MPGASEEASVFIDGESLSVGPCVPLSGSAWPVGMGVQVPAAEMSEFKRFPGTLGYPYIDESGNPAYRLFLG